MIDNEGAEPLAQLLVRHKPIPGMGDHCAIGRPSRHAGCAAAESRLRPPWLRAKTSDSDSDALVET